MNLFHKHKFIEKKDGTTYCEGCGKAGQCSHEYEVISTNEIVNNSDIAYNRVYTLQCKKCGKMDKHLAL